MPIIVLCWMNWKFENMTSSVTLYKPAWMNYKFHRRGSKLSMRWMYHSKNILRMHRNLPQNVKIRTKYATKVKWI